MGNRIPRGIRNNNPLNIRRSKSAWMGLAEQQTDSEFCVFQHMKWGWRAAFKLLCDTYYKQWNLRTIRDIIHRWAPPNDGNHTDVYIAQVAMSIGWPDTKELPDPKENQSIWRRLGWAMARIENGGYNHLGYEDCIVGFSLYLNPSSKMSYKRKGV
jgi:hypothetical protein